MEVSYKKDFDRNYMIVKIENSKPLDFRIRMLQDNVIKGINNITLKEFNNTEYIYYDISGGLSMSNMFIDKKIKADEIKRYVLGIQRIVESCREYMLDINKIMVDMEYVYYKTKDSLPYFCYYPDKEEMFEKSLQKVFDQIIKIADHSDRETIILSYGLQQLQIEDNNMTINDVLNFINNCKLDITEKEEDIKQPKASVSDEKIIENKTDVKREKSGNEAPVHNDKAIPRWMKEIIEPVIQVGRNLIGRNNIAYRKEDELNINFEEYETGIYQDSYVAENKIYGNEAINSYSYNINKCNNTELEEDEDNTILLRSQALGGGIILKCTDIEMAHTIVPNNYPCILGKSKKSSDYVIDDKTVSRVHLRIYRDNGEYLIEDLNSSNGSYLNNKKLYPHQPEKVVIGDKIKLSNIEYIVC